MAGFVLGCVDPLPGGIPVADRAAFERDVFPVLLRDCAFHACHGSTQRFFQVFGPGRARLSPELRPLDDITPAEIEHSFTRALSMLEPADMERSPLIAKPLAIAAGGVGHEGSDALGRDVYQSADDPAYRILHTWVVAAAVRQ
jgi:hypothetical protein